MKTFEIKKVQIKDFRCIEYLGFDLGKQIKIYSDNEGGKSTIASAITWCLNGKNIENQSTFDIVPYGKQGLVSPKVELECLIDGETPLTLTRIYQAKFTRDKQFSKYDTVCLVNGLDVGVKKFQEYISENICDEQVFKILSVPKTFIEECPKQTKELLWQAQRRMLMKIAGNEVNDSDVAYADAKYSLLEEPLKRYNDVNTYLIYLKKELTAIGKEIGLFESKLAQQEKNIVESKYGSTKEIQAELERVSTDKENLIRLNEEHKQQGQSDKKDKLSKRYEELKAERDNIHQEYLVELRKYDNDKKAVEIKIAEKQSAINKLINTQNEYVKALETLKNGKVKTVYSSYCTSLPKFLKELPAKLNSFSEPPDVVIVNSYVTKTGTDLQEFTTQIRMSYFDSHGEKKVKDVQVIDSGSFAYGKYLTNGRIPTNMLYKLVDVEPIFNSILPKDSVGYVDPTEKRPVVEKYNYESIENQSGDISRIVKEHIGKSLTRTLNKYDESKRKRENEYLNKLVTDQFDELQRGEER